MGPSSFMCDSNLIYQAFYLPLFPYEIPISLSQVGIIHRLIAGRFGSIMREAIGAGQKPH